MFGYIVANGNALDEAQLERYRGCYCGLCRALKERHGNLSRLALNYDMTFLVILLSGMYEPEEQGAEGRCMVHPRRRRSWWRSRFTDYAADMTVALAYHNCLDDYRDEKKVLPLAESKLLKRHYDTVRRRWPAQCEALERTMAELGELEQARISDPDAAANRFGTLMGELFACEPDPVWNPRFRAFGEALGRFIYMMDACVDFEKDLRRGNYNPLVFMREYADGVLTDEEKTGILKMLIADCAAEFEALPIVQDADILRSVLYSGVWTQYMASAKQKKGEPPDEQRSL
ncbi:MAG: hypothetical protein IJ705_09855 [Oscillospiraceae bacterium]|nr:hypothetical protein [Oscillospiraceae bacterium]